ncbi:hypothetical protein PVK06_036943 [Gossypium arboreum]|uniref:RNase H type-1 domain-containing protein n=1 Tax=Gossypium arboreum TaxID=29729 RepID=A0ABR0NKW4_GOSAR|nr:hypothetical protein PVK06_036943 [Gossypium arboreum]
MVGGVLWDFSGNWVEGFQGFIGRESVVNSELWAILHDLEITLNRGYNKVIMETDCMMAMEMIKEGLGSTHSTTIVRKIKMMPRQFASVKFQFVNREGNMIVHWLARTFPSSEVDLVRIDVPLFHIRKLLLEDKLDDTHIRIN